MRTPTAADTTRHDTTRQDTTRQDTTRQDTTGDAGWAMAEPTAPMDKLVKTIPFVLGRLISFAYRCRLNDGRGPRGSSRGACRWVLTHPASPVGKASVGDIVPPEAIRRRGVAFEKVHTLRFGSQRRLHLRRVRRDRRRPLFVTRIGIGVSWCTVECTDN